MSIMKQYILGLTIVLFLFCFATYAAEYSDGKLGKALILDGSSQTIKIPHYAGLKPDKAITISAWIKPERVGKGGWAWQQIYRKEDGNARALMAIGEYEKIIKDLMQEGIVIKDVAFCPHSPDENCDCRKPSPKMILDLMQKHGIEQGFMIGDKAIDAECGIAAGIEGVHLTNSDSEYPKFKKLIEFAKSIS